MKKKYLKAVNISSFVRSFRHACGYSQGDLAKILKYNAQMISNVERQRMRVPKEFCRRLDKHLDRSGQIRLKFLLQKAAVKKALSEVSYG
jgi:ribosome-binding protein aMBF1 (putative translation factor)